MIMIEIFFKLKSKHNLYFIYNIPNQSIYMCFVIFIKINQNAIIYSKFPIVVMEIVNRFRDNLAQTTIVDPFIH